MGALWSAEAEARAGGGPVLDWSALPSINRIINRRITGDEDGDWLVWLRDEFADGPFDLGLSIGCGTGEVDRAVLELGLCSRMEGVDVAEGALEVARRLAGDRPLEYRREDLETVSIEPGRYDIIFSAATLHHINNLESCVAGLHAGLREGGLLAVCEYTGPPRFQWSPEQLRLVSDIFSFLPWRCRYDHKISGTRRRLERPEVCSMVTGDPSEAVRSSEVLGVIERYFEPLGSRPIAGTLLNPLLAGIAANFDESSESDLAFLRLAAELEELLVEGGALPSDFVVAVYRRRSDPEIPNADLERGRRVREGERVIEELLARFAVLERSNEETVERIEAARRLAGETGAEVSRLQEGNAALKTGPLFAAAGLARKLAGRRGAGAAPAARESTRPPVRSAAPADAPLVPAQLFEELTWATPEAVSARRFVDGLGCGGEVLWLRWAALVAGARAARALFVGMEPAMAGPAVRAGLCAEVDQARAVEASGGFAVESAEGGTAEPSGRYEVVLLDLVDGRAGAGSAGAAAAAVAEGGALVAVSAVGRPEPADYARLERLLEVLPEAARQLSRKGRTVLPGGLEDRPKAEVLEELADSGLILEAARGFGSALGDAASLLACRQGASDMDRAVARLLVYSEGELIRAGLLEPAMEVVVYRRGSVTAPAGSEPVTDILAIQEAEIERLRGKVSEVTARCDELDDELRARLEALERASLDLHLLRMEKNALEDSGFARYRGFLEVFAARRGRGSRS